jgi:hypothetical protein
MAWSPRTRTSSTRPRETRSLHLTPRLSYKFDSGDTLNFQPFVMVNRSDGDARSDLTQNAASLQPPEYNLRKTHSHSKPPSCAASATGCTSWKARPSWT